MRMRKKIVIGAMVLALCLGALSFSAGAAGNGTVQSVADVCVSLAFGLDANGEAVSMSPAVLTEYGDGKVFVETDATLIAESDPVSYVVYSGGVEYAMEYSSTYSDLEITEFLIRDQDLADTLPPAIHPQQGMTVYLAHYNMDTDEVDLGELKISYEDPEVYDEYARFGLDLLGAEYTVALPAALITETGKIAGYVDPTGIAYTYGYDDTFIVAGGDPSPDDSPDLPDTPGIIDEPEDPGDIGVPTGTRDEDTKDDKNDEDSRGSGRDTKDEDDEKGIMDYLPWILGIAGVLIIVVIVIVLVTGKKKKNVEPPQVYQPNGGFQQPGGYQPQDNYQTLGYQQPGGYQPQGGQGGQPQPYNGMGSNMGVEPTVGFGESIPPTGVVPPAPRPVKPVLYGQGGEMDGRRYSLTNASTVIGRDPSCCHILYSASSSGVSRKHCSVIWRDGVLMLMDEGSSNGTFLKGTGKLTPMAPVPLKNGDVFFLGEKNNAFQVSIE